MTKGGKIGRWTLSNIINKYIEKITFYGYFRMGFHLVIFFFCTSLILAMTLNFKIKVNSTENFVKLLLLFYYKRQWRVTESYSFW